MSDVPGDPQSTEDYAAMLFSLAMTRTLKFWEGTLAGVPCVFAGRVYPRENGNVDAIPVAVLYSPAINELAEPASGYKAEREPT